MAANSGVNLKPVILFKAQRTIAQSQENKENFHKLIDELTATSIDKFRESNLEVVQRAFRFFDEKGITTEALVQRLKSAFREDHCLSEEKAFVQMLDRWIQEQEKIYEDIYLLRNEGHFSIYNFSDGRPFQPDFVLFLCSKNGESQSYQLFIEPKGEHLAETDRWKEEFLQEIRAEYQSKILTENSKYRVIGVPSFYHERYENQFKDDLNAALTETAQSS